MCKYYILLQAEGELNMEVEADRKEVYKELTQTLGKLLKEMVKPDDAAPDKEGGFTFQENNLVVHHTIKLK